MITGDPKARMHWAHYFRNVVARYMVIIKGWPNEIPFTNLSNVSSSLAQLKMLHRKWEMGLVCWEKLMEAEFEQLRWECNEQVKSQAITESIHCVRSNKGKKHSGRSQRGTRPCHNQDYRSADIINDSNDDTSPSCSTKLTDSTSIEQ